MMQEKENRKKWLAAWADENRLIGYDLHDGLIQWLVGARMQLESVSNSEEIPQEKNRQKINKAQALLDEAIQQARDLIRNFSAATIEKGCLPMELEEWFSDERYPDVKIHKDFDDDLSLVEPLLAGSIFHILREAICNVGKHAKATNVFLSARRIAQNWLLMVLDNGQGALIPEESRDCHGIRGVRARTEIFGGNFELLSSSISSIEFNRRISQLRSSFPEWFNLGNLASGTLLQVTLPHQE